MAPRMKHTTRPHSSALVPMVLSRMGNRNAVTIKGQGHDPNDLVLDLSKVYATTTPGAYPILLASYETVCSKYPDADVGTAVKAFMQSTITEGQQGLAPLGYIPLPSDFQTKVAAAINNIS
jgi:phosphate transport system substrate-binding protein